MQERTASYVKTSGFCIYRNRLKKISLYVIITLIAFFRSG